jgi:glutamate-1-semialdehyde 2,1-aminomutase
VQRVGAMLTAFMNDAPVWNFASAQGSDTKRYGELFRHVLERGVYMAPSQFEAMFVSTAHGPAEVERTVEAARELLGS